MTQAIAVQLAVILERSPNDKAKGEVGKWEKRLRALENELDDLSADEIHARLLTIRTAILEILEPFGAKVLPTASDVSGESTEETTGGGEGSVTAPSIDTGADLAPDGATVSISAPEAPATPSSDQASSEVAMEDDPDEEVKKKEKAPDIAPAADETGGDRPEPPAGEAEPTPAPPDAAPE